MARPFMLEGGASGAINIFSSTPSLIGWLRQRRAFWIARRRQWQVRAFTGREPAQITLKRLNILHTATWLRLGRFPHINDVPSEPFRHLLFCSNFAGPWDPYRQAFLDVLPGGIKTFWGRSVGFPRFPAPGTRYQLESWMHHRLPPTAHYYRAFPGVAPSDVRGAARLSRELEAFRVNVGRRGVDDDAAMLAEFRQLQVRLAECLGATVEPALPRPVLGPPRATGMSNFVSVAPLEPGREDAVRDRILSLPRGRRSPFRSVPGTHFARLAVLDRRTATYHPNHNVPLLSSWLLFAADIDGTFDEGEARARRMADDELTRYLTLVGENHELRNVWQDCVGYSADRGLADLLLPTVLQRFFLFLDHGDLTLRDIYVGLRTRRVYQSLVAAGALRDAADVRALLDETHQIALDAV